MSSTGEPMPGLEKQRVLAAVAQDGGALQYAAAELQRDREVVMAAVAQNGDALKYAAAELQRDPMLLQLQTLKAVQGLLRRSAPCEGEPPERGATTDSA